ncbi:ACP S-malonyltransferase [Candidatus Daviesbacteria bacterium]|nr:ACP S-malonyltransferase [Candidatus Daviesbacteria bacterium]
MVETKEFVTFDHPAFTKPENTAFVFPGQGIQKVGMGRDIFEYSEGARETYRIADEIATEFGYSVSDISFNGPKEDLDRLSQTLILTRNRAYGVAVCEHLGKNFRPAAVAGYSLGELNAIEFAGSGKYTDLFRAVETRREECKKANGKAPGGEAAIILRETGLTADYTQFLSEGLIYLNKTEGLYLALATSDTYFVIAGTNEALKGAEEFVKDFRRRTGNKGILFQRLAVEGAYHTPLMLPAQEGLRKTLNETEILDANIPIIANTTGQPMEKAKDIRAEILAHLISPVQWYRSIRRLYKTGIRYVVEPGDKPLITSVSLKEGRILLPVKAEENGPDLAYILMPGEEAYAA